MNEHKDLSITEALELSNAVLRAAGLSAPHAAAIARNIVRAQVDDCHSHGLHRLIMCARTVSSGKVTTDAVPTVTRASASVVKVDAHSGFSLLAFEAGLPTLAAMAGDTGVAVMAINNAFHFSALWPEVEDLAERGMAGLAMLPSHSCVAPAGGARALFGTNPFAFGWPRGGVLPPYVFDFATSAAARGEIELHRRAGKPLPDDWAVDSHGRPTNDAAAALQGALLPFGGHKGSALSTMIELLAGALIGDALSMDALEHAGTLDIAPRHGELIIAFDPKILGSGDSARDSQTAERLFAAISAQGARLPSERRYAARARNEARHAVTIPQALWLEISKLPRR